MNLFDMSDSPSPRLKWMQENGIKTIQANDGRWIAYKSETSHKFTHESEVDAVVGLAKQLKIKLWKE